MHLGPLIGSSRIVSSSFPRPLVTTKISFKPAIRQAQVNQELDALSRQASMLVNGSHDIDETLYIGGDADASSATAMHDDALSDALIEKDVECTDAFDADP